MDHIVFIMPVSDISLWIVKFFILFNAESWVTKYLRNICVAGRSAESGRLLYREGGYCSIIVEKDRYHVDVYSSCTKNYSLSFICF